MSPEMRRTAAAVPRDTSSLPDGRADASHARCRPRYTRVTNEKDHAMRMAMLIAPASSAPRTPSAGTSRAHTPRCAAEKTASAALDQWRSRGELVACRKACVHASKGTRPNVSDEPRYAWGGVPCSLGCVPCS